MSGILEEKNNTVVIVGAGIAGLSAAAYLAKEGYKVTVLEKNKWVGGRIHTYSEKGYTFDLGPSWYWMKDVFENFFADFNYKTEDFYNLIKLNPSYRVYFDDEEFDVPASPKVIKKLFQRLEEGSGNNYDKLLADTKSTYEICMKYFIPNSYRSLKPLLNKELIKNFPRLLFSKNSINSIYSYHRSLFSNPKITKLLEFPIFFLGESSRNIPAVYALMNYVDFVGGSWYPMGGFSKVAEAIDKIAIENGATIKKNEEVTSISKNKVITKRQTYTADFIIANADYAYVEQRLLPKSDRSYDEKYWESRKLAPSALIICMGINKKINSLRHHTLFFQNDWDQHYSSLFSEKKWPTKPLYYVSCTSKTDSNTAPKGCESVLVLIPIASGLPDNEKTRKKYINFVIADMEKRTGGKFNKNIEVIKTYAINDFAQDFNAYKGNAYGLAQTTFQTAIFRPSMKSKKVSNLYYCGHFTVPGIGVPTAIISGKLVAKEIINNND